MIISRDFGTGVCNKLQKKIILKKTVWVLALAFQKADQVQTYTVITTLRAVRSINFLAIKKQITSDL